MKRSHCKMPNCKRFRAYHITGLCENCHHTIYEAKKRMKFTNEVAWIYRCLDLMQREAKDFMNKYDGRRFHFGRTIEVPTANHTIEISIYPT